MDRVHQIAATFQQAVYIIKEEHNSPVGQTPFKNYLSILHVSDFVADGMEVSASIERVYQLVLKLWIQVPQSHLRDAHRI